MQTVHGSKSATGILRDFSIARHDSGDTDAARNAHCLRITCSSVDIFPLPFLLNRFRGLPARISPAEVKFRIQRHSAIAARGGNVNQNIIGSSGYDLQRSAVLLIGWHLEPPG
jgi:hypothetical protein